MEYDSRSFLSILLVGCLAGGLCGCSACERAVSVEKSSSSIGGDVDQRDDSDVDSGQLQAFIAESWEIDKGENTNFAYSAYSLAINEGAALLGQDGLTQARVDQAVERIRAAREGLALPSSRETVEDEGGEAEGPITEDAGREKDKVFTYPNWPGDVNDRFVALKDATSGGGPTYVGVRAAYNPVGEGVFFWAESQGLLDTYKTYCWLVVDGAVFRLNADSGCGVSASWPEGKSQTWSVTNLPEDFRITVDRDAQVVNIIGSLEKKYGSEP